MMRSDEARDLPGFRLRGREVTRLESFSDAVFGFALTLLVVSLDVPKSFDDLLTTMRGFPAFAVCFLLLALIWNGHYKFYVAGRFARCAKILRRSPNDDARFSGIRGLFSPPRADLEWSLQVLQTLRFGRWHSTLSHLRVTFP